jgi:hypothetical protein
MCAACNFVIDLRNPVCACTPDPRDTRIASLEAEVARLRKNDERYRWLRDGAGYICTGLYVADGGKDWRGVVNDELDSRIDAELAALSAATDAKERG